MVRLESQHFKVGSMAEAKALRRRMAELGHALTDRARRSPVARWLKGHYVTASTRPHDEWIAWLKSSDPADLEVVLTALAHPHLVLPQDGKAPWLGINIEFKGPRETLHRCILDEPEALRDAITKLEGAEVWIVVKSVRPDDHRNPIWHDDWPGWHAPHAQAFGARDLESLRAVLEDPLRPPSPLPGYVTEPAVVFAWPLSEGEIVASGDRLADELLERLLPSADLLRLLAGA